MNDLTPINTLVAVKLTNRWPIERDIRLKELYDRGWSAAVIGEEIGMTRNAVIGRIHRKIISDGWVRRSSSVRKSWGSPFKSKQGARAERLPAPKRTPERRKVAITLAQTTSLPIAAPRPVLRLSARKNILDLAANECRWPTGRARDGTHVFCGARKSRGSYCEVHRAQSVNLNYIPWGMRG